MLWNNCCSNCWLVLTEAFGLCNYIIYWVFKMSDLCYYTWGHSFAIASRDRFADFTLSQTTCKVTFSWAVFRGFVLLNLSSTWLNTCDSLASWNEKRWTAWWPRVFVIEVRATAGQTTFAFCWLHVHVHPTTNLLPIWQQIINVCKCNSWHWSRP